MKNKKIFKAMLSIIIILLSLFSIGYLAYSLTFYEGVETFYRIYAIVILIYFFLLLSYLELRSIKKKSMKSFLIPAFISIVFISAELYGSYYLKKIYKSMNYTDNSNIKYTSLVTYDKSLNSEKDLKKKVIGIASDGKEEGYELPQEKIKELKLGDNNEIKTYNSTIELLYALKNKEVDAAFFSANYADMFYSLEGYENISEETKVIYKAEKEYKSSNDDDIKSNEASLTKPFTMLLIGVDSSKDGVTSGYNGDVLLLVTFNPDTLRATITSVPRDTYLKTACSNGSYRRINTTTWGSSASCAVKTMENLFGVNIDYYAKINFKGVVQLVDAVGGIDVDVPYSFCEQNSSRVWGDKTVFVEKGMQHLNGEQALALSRNRHSAKDSKGMRNHCPTWTEGKRNDFTRGKNQIKVILGIVNAATKKLTNPDEAINILNSIKSNFQTNITNKDILSLYNLGKSLVISDSTNLVNVERMQLKTYGVWRKVYEPASKSYPAVEIPYTGSINDIKKAININLGKTKPTLIKTASFDLNKPYEATLIGNGKYKQSTIATLADVSKYTVSELKSYASRNSLKLSFIDVDTNKTVDISDYSNYRFYSQKEHTKIILDQLSTLTIYVKKKAVTPVTTPTISKDSTNDTNN